jgi:hypothetical protein
MAELSITSGLQEISRRLTDAAAIAKGAVACAEGGSERETLRIAMDLTNYSTRRRPCTAPFASWVERSAAARADAMRIEISCPEWMGRGR